MDIDITASQQSYLSDSTGNDSDSSYDQSEEIEREAEDKRARRKKSGKNKGKNKKTNKKKGTSTLKRRQAVGNYSKKIRDDDYP